MSVDEKMTAIADRIRHYAHETGKLTLDDMANKIEMVNLSGYNNGFMDGIEIGRAEGNEQGYSFGFEEGKQAEYDAFWDIRQNAGKAADYESAFYNYPAKLYNPKYDFVFGVSAYSANNTFRGSKITDLIKNCDFTVLNDAVGLTYTFYRADKLVNARTIKVKASNKYNNPFYACSALEEIRFDGVIGQNGLTLNCPKLNKASIESVINHLSATTSGLTVTLSKTAVNNAFGIDVDDASTYPEGSEYYTLRQSKSNWTINYV
jgi:hypothetical protein